MQFEIFFRINNSTHTTERMKDNFITEIKFKKKFKSKSASQLTLTTVERKKISHSINRCSDVPTQTSSFYFFCSNSHDHLVPSDQNRNFHSLVSPIITWNTKKGRIMKTNLSPTMASLYAPVHKMHFINSTSIHSSMIIHSHYTFYFMIGAPYTRFNNLQLNEIRFFFHTLNRSAYEKKPIAYDREYVSTNKSMCIRISMFITTFIPCV